MTQPARLSPDPRVSGVVLAGGLARRFGGQDKGLLPCAGRPLVAYALGVLGAVAAHVFINANRHMETYRALGAEVVPDASPNFDGPLAGMLAALRAATTPWVLVIPCDCPRVQGSDLARLIEAGSRDGARIAVAHDGTRLNPVFALLDRTLADDLEQFLASGERKIDLWMQRHHPVLVDFSDRPEMFLNANTPEELAALEAQCRTPSA